MLRFTMDVTLDHPFFHNLEAHEVSLEDVLEYLTPLIDSGDVAVVTEEE